MKNRGGLVLKLAVSLFLVGLLARRYAGDADFLAAIGKLSPVTFLTAELVLVGGLVLSALRWKILLGAAGVSLGFGTSFRLYLSGYFFNLFLPTTVGGDVVRAMGVGRGTPLPVVGGSILVERMLGFGCLLAIGLVASFALETLAVAKGVLLVSAAIFAAGTAVLLFAPLPDRRERPGRLGRFLGGLERTAREVRAFGFHPAALGLAVLLSFAWQLALVAANGILSRGVGDVAPFEFLLALVPTIQAVTMIPISFGGLGLREAGYDYFFAAAGLDPAGAVALAAAFLGVAIALALKGGIVYLLFPVRREEG